MPPKPRFTREEIVDAALDIVSRKGIEALTARELGEALGSSAPDFHGVPQHDGAAAGGAERRYAPLRELCRPHHAGRPAVQAGRHADGSLRRVGAEALSAALHARKSQRRQL